MLRSILIALLLPVICHAQHTWHTVAAPTKPLVSGFTVNQSSLSNHTWRYPFDQPTPAGTYEVSNAIIDKSQNLGAWSQPKTLVVQSGWFLYGAPWNQPVTSDEAGIAWKVKVVSATQFEYSPYTPGSEHYFFTGWGGQYLPNAVAPYSGTVPKLQLLDGGKYSLSHFQTGGRHTTIAPPPIAIASNLPLVPMEIAYCRVTETGETALSPSFVFSPPVAQPGWTLAETCRLGFGIQEQHPQGTLGYHVYVRPTGGTWQRIPAPHCYGEPATVDDWLWQWHDRQPTIVRVVENAPTHSPVADPQSRLNTLQMAIMNTVGTVQAGAKSVDALPATPKPTAATVVAKLNEVIASLDLTGDSKTLDTYCPIIDEWRSAPPTFGRRGAARDGGKWVVRQQQSQSGHKYWPVVAVENSYSQWVGVEVQANGGSAALSFSDWSGGQAFGNRFVDCNFYTQPSTTGLVCGILVEAKSTGQYGSHVHSEGEYVNVKANGDIPVWIAGQQAANITFNRANITCTGAGRRCSAVYLECPSQVFFINGLNLDARHAGAVFRASTFNSKLIVDRIWLDQESPCIIEACGVAFDVQLNRGKINLRGTRPLLARYIDQHYSSRLIFTDIDTQPDPGTTGVDVVNGLFNQVELRFTDTHLADFTTLREPTYEQVVTDNPTPWIPVIDYPVPGLRIIVPTTPGFIGPTVEQSVVFNSMTGRQTVRRANWRD